MAAPPPGRPVAITIGTVMTFHLNPPPPRPQRLPVGAVVIIVVLTVARVFFGAVYLKECPQQPNIPNYLLGLALISLIMVPFFHLPCDRHVVQPQENPGGWKDCLKGLCGLFGLIWILLGDVWVFSVYQPNYDPAAAGGLYCNWNLYTFAFWNAIYETFAIGWMLAGVCRGMLVYAVMTPVPTNTDFYNRV